MFEFQQYSSHPNLAILNTAAKLLKIEEKEHASH